MQFGLSLGKNSHYALCDVIYTHFGVYSRKQNKKLLGKTVSEMWCQILRKNLLCVNKTNFRKKVKKKEKKLVFGGFWGQN